MDDSQSKNTAELHALTFLSRNSVLRVSHSGQPGWLISCADIAFSGFRVAPCSPVLKDGALEMPPAFNGSQPDRRMGSHSYDRMVVVLLGTKRGSGTLRRPFQALSDVVDVTLPAASWSNRHIPTVTPVSKCLADRPYASWLLTTAT